MRLYPAIDILGGRCVRLFQGDYHRATVYGGDPAAMARTLVGRGARRLHLVDLDGARAGRPVNLEVVRAVREAVAVPLQVGGGMRSRRDVAAVLAAGADRVVLGTRAAQDGAFLRSMLEVYGERVVLGLDARDGKVAVGGWLQTTSRSAVDLAEEARTLGAREAVYTDIATDGTLSGPNLVGLREMGERGLGVIASGGIRSPADLEAVAAIPGVVGAIVGKAIYTGDFDLEKAVEMEEQNAG